MLNSRQYLYATVSIAGLIWPFYFIAQFIQNIRVGLVDSSISEIGKTFFAGAWANPTAGFVSADTAILLIGIFLFYFSEGRRLKLKLWGLYFPLTFLISLAFSFGAFMFMREKRLSEIEQN